MTYGTLTHCHFCVLQQHEKFQWWPKQIREGKEIGSGQISKEMADLLKSGGCIKVTVTDYPVTVKREGMRVPCQYQVHGIAKLVYDIKRNTSQIRWKTF